MVWKRQQDRSNPPLRDRHTVTGLWTGQAGRTQRTTERQAVLSCLPNGKPNSIHYCHHTCTGVALSPLGLGPAGLWACSWGCVWHSQSSRLSVLLVTRSTDLISPIFSPKVSNCMRVYSHILMCMYIYIYTLPPHQKPKSQGANSLLRDHY